MNNTFLVNRGSDLNFQFNWKDANLVNLNLTSYTLTLLDVSPALNSFLTVTIQTPATGLIVGKIEYSDTFQNGISYNFRIKITSGAADISTNLLSVIYN